MKSHAMPGTLVFLALISWNTLAQAQPLSIATAAVPPATAGSAYAFTFAASGGRPPYQWQASGSLPGSFTLNASSGVLSGTPDRRGTFNITVQVADSAGATATANFALTVNVPPLAITTDSPLFNGITGNFYSQVFQASGGTPPYTWSIISGQAPAGLAFDAGAGALSGTPSAPGTYSLTVRVADSAALAVSKSFNITIDPPRLTIVNGAVLPAGAAGTAYSQKLSAAGGTPPYTWSMPGTLAGLTLDGSTGVLSGTPPAPGSFAFTVQVKDSAGLTATKALTLPVNPAQLTITTATNLPDGRIGVAYALTMAAKGGVPPYSWSANGLPDGLKLDALTGAISGSPQAGGPLVFTVKVTDSAHTAALDLFHVNIGLPVAPSLTISGLSSSANPAEQPTLHLTLDSPYPVPISGQLTLTFLPDTGAGDSTIQFVTGGRQVDFNIPAGSTEAAFAAPALMIQTGTVAGSINLAARFSAGGVDITPDPQPSCTTRISRGGPVITAAKLVRTDAGIEVSITGFSTALEVSQAVFRFTTSGNNALQNAEVTVAVDGLFATWYQDTGSVRYGSQFTFTQPFTVKGDASAVALQSVTLTNRFGTVTSNAN
jgi:hypothetical protein